MKAYMGFDRIGGSEEGACRVFAPNAKVARKLAWKILQSWFQTEWFDAAVRLMKNLPSHLVKLDTGEEQSIESPESCPKCLHWGGEIIPPGESEDGGCELCDTWI